MAASVFQGQVRSPPSNGWPGWSAGCPAAKHRSGKQRAAPHHRAPPTGSVLPWPLPLLTSEWPLVASGLFLASSKGHREIETFAQEHTARIQAQSCVFSSKPLMSDPLSSPIHQGVWHSAGTYTSVYVSCPAQSPSSLSTTLLGLPRSPLSQKCAQ